MASKRLLSDIIDVLIRIGIILFLFSLMFRFLIYPGAENPIIRSGLAIFFILFSIAILLIQKNYLNLFGFMIVFIAATFRSITIIDITGFHQELGAYFFIIIISIYFMTKEQRRKRGIDDNF